MQLAGRRHFVHEHPDGSTAWQTPSLVELMARPEVEATVLHMCAYGMKATDEHGEGLVYKSTRIASSASEVLKRVGMRCSNEAGGGQHRHVHLERGRAKAAQVYPRKLCAKICEGLAAQKKIEQLGLAARPVMTVEEMQQVANVKADENPSESLHHADAESEYSAWDDQSGQRLDPRLMIQARKDEIKYFREMGVYDKVDISEAGKETGRPPIGVRWVDINKGDSENPLYRSRLVAKEFKVGNAPELYAATPQRVPPIDAQLVG